MRQQGILTVVSGFSGAGKGTIMKALLETYDNYALSISATTRNPRPGEENGREYFFITKEEFEALIEQEALIEYARYVDHYYGTPRAYVEEQLSLGKDVILEIEIQGALKVKERFPQALLVFITPPEAKELERRLTGRGTEERQVIEKRLLRAAKESDGMDSYDYIVVNDVVEDCTRKLHELIQSQHLKVVHNRELTEKIKGELKELVGSPESD